MNQIKYILSACLILLMIYSGILLHKTFSKSEYSAENESRYLAVNGVSSQGNTVLTQILTTREIEGKDLFEKNCHSCHAINKTDDHLAGFENRGPWNNRNELYKWIQNPKEYISNDTTGYTAGLKDAYNVLMPSFPHLSNNDIDKILDYIVKAQN